MQISFWDGRGMSLGLGDAAPLWKKTLWWYFIHIFQAKRQFVAKVSASKMYHVVLFFFISWGSSREEQKPERVVVGEVNPECSSCDKVLASQACSWYWEKIQQTNRKEKEEAACGRRKSMAIDGEAPTLPEVVEGEPASSAASCWISETPFYGRRGNYSYFHPWTVGCLVWMVCGEGGQNFPQFPLLRLLIGRLLGWAQGFSLGARDEGKSLQKWTHSCFNRYQRERLAPEKSLLILQFITSEWCGSSGTQIEDISFSRVFTFNLCTWRIGSIVHGQREQFPPHCSFVYWR